MIEGHKVNLFDSNIFHIADKQNISTNHSVERTYLYFPPEPDYPPIDSDLILRKLDGFVFGIVADDLH